MDKQNQQYKAYLGDSVYIDFDGYGLVLTTENGIETTNRIYLEPEVFNKLEVYVKELKKQLLDARD